MSTRTREIESVSGAKVASGGSWKPEIPSCAHTFHRSDPLLLENSTKWPAPVSSPTCREGRSGATERNEKLSQPAANSREIPWQSPVATRKGVSDEIDSNESGEGPSHLRNARGKICCGR